MYDNLESWWAIRITTEVLELSKSYAIFDEFSDKFIISQEGGTDSTKLHQHVLLVTDQTDVFIKEQIRLVYPDAKTNKGIYCRPSRDKRQLAKYTVKEGEYLYKGFTTKYISDTFKTSIAKTDLKKEVTNNEDRYILGEITTEQFIEKYIEIKVKHDQNLYMNHIQAYITKLMVRQGSLKSSTLSDLIIHRIRMSVE